ncbi:MAG: helix-turn-helix domain-containing protein [Elusimicrobia bacterium]|nr:helix-turn-helix domain-containing protein [Elusimicrobiota bacterium]
MSEQELITLTDVAERLQLHPETVRRLYRHGKIPGIKFGHRTLRFDYAKVVEALHKPGIAMANIQGPVQVKKSPVSDPKANITVQKKVEAPAPVKTVKAPIDKPTAETTIKPRMISPINILRRKE